MKKKLIVGLMITSSLFITVGCGKKEEVKQEVTPNVPKDGTLFCKINDNKDNNSFEFTFKENKIAEVTYVVKNEYETDKKAKSQAETSKKDASKYQKMRGIDTNVELEDKIVTSSIRFVVADLDRDAREVYDSVFREISELSYDKVKENLVSSNYECEDK